MKALGIVMFAAVLAWSCQQQPTVSTTKGTVAVECDESLFPTMQFQAEDFHNTYPEATIQLHSVEAREAVVNFMNDSIRSIVLGRPFNKEELDFIKSASIDYEGYKVAYDAVVVLIHRQNPDTTIRVSELDSIYSGMKTRWTTGKKQLIDAYIGSVNSSVDEVFRAVILKGRPFGATITRLASSEMIVEAVKKNPNAIGLVGLSWMRDHEHEVRVCRLGGGTYRPVAKATARIEGVNNNQQRIVITQLPLQADREAFVQRIKELTGNKTLTNVSTVLDESSGDRIRIVLLLESQANAEEVLNALHQHTEMVDTTLVTGQFFSPAQAHILHHYYPITREVYMYTREVRRDAGYGFIAYVKDRRGQQNFVNHGLLPAVLPVRIVGLTTQKVNQQ